MKGCYFKAVPADEEFPSFLRSVSCLVCAHQKGPAGNRLGKMYSIYTNKDCLTISARKLSARIQLGLVTS